MLKYHGQGEFLWKNKMVGMDRKGFSLIEVLIAFVILAVGLLGLAALHITAIRSNAGSNELTYATFLCQNEMERLKALPFSHTDLEEGSHNRTVNYKGIEYLVSWEVQDGVPDEDFKMVRVTVSWTGTNPADPERQGRSVNATAVFKRD